MAVTGFQIRVCIGKLFSLFLIQNICCGYSQKHMFQLMGKKINLNLMQIKFPYLDLCVIVVSLSRSFMFIWLESGQ